MKAWQTKILEKYSKAGADALDDHEVFAFCLGVKTPGQIAESIENAGGVRRIVDNPTAWGFDRQDENIIRLIFEAFHRYNRDRFLPQRIMKPEAVFAYVKARESTTSESLFAIYTNLRLEILDEREMFKGTVGCANVFPREIVRRALILGASGVVLAHNHNGAAKVRLSPSQADRMITKDTQKACALLDINLIDHIICGQDSWYSMRVEGDLDAETIYK